MVVDDAFQVAPFLPAPPVSAFDIRRRRPGWPAATTPASPLCASAGIPPPSRSAAADRPVGQARTIFHKAGMAVCRAACTSRPRSPESKRPATSGAMPRLPQGWTTSGEQTRSTSQERLRLARWYRAGLNPQSRLPWLSAYLGHTDVFGTEKYLNATPQLLDVAARRFKRRFHLRRGLP